jgi:putative spermidine/putrescine transport system substrate-binding protein
MIQGRTPVRGTLIALSAVVVLALTGCGSSSKNSSSGSGTTTPGSSTKQAGTAGLTPPTHDMAPLQSVGASEGKLNLIAWEGYTEPQWVKPFEQQSGCTVNAKYAGTSSEMVSLMANGGGGQYDMVSASGDADLRLIYGGDVKPVNVDLVPAWKQFHPFLQNPSFNTIDGVHYGVSLQFGPNVLLYSTAAIPSAPASWSAIYSNQYAGKVTVPNNPIQIADAALYLSKTQANLGITDPYELTQTQFDAAVNLLKQQKPLIKKYWNLASEEESLFQNKEAVIGAAWPLQTGDLKKAGFAAADTIPSEGATGWADSWLLATKAPHPNCAYKWMAYISTAKPQAQQALSFGETPANALACPIMNNLEKGGCARLHADKPDAYFQSLQFWKTPLAQCGNGQSNCVPFQKWQDAWTQITG